jgi:hypothetical protein
LVYVGIKKQPTISRLTILSSYGLFDGSFSKKIIALASMTYIIDLNAYELHPGDEKVLDDFINECYGFTLYI